MTVSNACYINNYIIQTLPQNLKKALFFIIQVIGTLPYPATLHLKNALGQLMLTIHNHRPKLSVISHRAMRFGRLLFEKPQIFEKETIFVGYFNAYLKKKIALDLPLKNAKFCGLHCENG